MDDFIGIADKESEFSLPTKSKLEKEADPLGSSQPTWSSRYKCFQAYTCYVMNYVSALRFCRRIGNYKVAIFLPYMLFNIIIGVPAVFVEIMLGRFVIGNVSHAFEMCPPAKGIFWCMALVTSYGIILNFIFNIYLLKYAFASFTRKWEHCDKQWNSIGCYKIGQKEDAMANCIAYHSEMFCNNVTWQTSEFQFWKEIVRNRQNISEFCISLTLLALAVIVIAAITYRGIQSLEKMLSLLMYPAIILWAVLVIASFSSPYALSGFKMLFDFRWTVFLNPRMWAEGFVDTFYLLGLGRLSLSYISCHGKFTDNILFDVLIVIFSSVTSCLLIITPVLSTMLYVKDLDSDGNEVKKFKDVIDVFVTVSEALLFFPSPTSLWSCLYYLDCFIIMLSSQAMLISALCEALEGVLNKKIYFYIIIVVSVVSFIAAASLESLEVIHSINHGTIIITIVLLCTLTWQLFYGVRKFNSDYFFMMGYPTPVFLKCTWITLPTVSFAGLLLKIYYKIPNIPVEYIIYLYCGIVLFIYILTIIVYLIKFYKRKESLLKVFMANPNWGPENDLLKKSRLLFDTSSVTREFMYRQELYKKPHIKPPKFAEQNVVQLI